MEMGELKATAPVSRPASKVSFRGDKPSKDSGDETGGRRSKQQCRSESS